MKPTPLLSHLKPSRPAPSRPDAPRQCDAPAPRDPPPALQSSPVLECSKIAESEAARLVLQQDRRQLRAAGQADPGEEHDLFFSRIGGRYGQADLSEEHDLFFSRIGGSYRKADLGEEHELFFSRIGGRYGQADLSEEHDLFFSRIGGSYRQADLGEEHELFFSRIGGSYRRPGRPILAGSVATDWEVTKNLTSEEGTRRGRRPQQLQECRGTGIAMNGGQPRQLQPVTATSQGQPRMPQRGSRARMD